MQIEKTITANSDMADREQGRLSTSKPQEPHESTKASECTSESVASHLQSVRIQRKAAPILHFVFYCLLTLLHPHFYYSFMSIFTLS